MGVAHHQLMGFLMLPQRHEDTKKGLRGFKSAGFMLIFSNLFWQIVLFFKRLSGNPDILLKIALK
ncbi:hypothetical protein PL8927_720176 [Planktothrix serta PCC 8927]|uniref:Uncharacterized protein n=1 Tax=Planktothrix serta PCC 8927 TaxID=671068 RepID=A0A7Z9BYK5_9CYAN|nr:hypothetical protein PL8927_720176 [Planktothrix serta PCC 8927]